MFSLAQIHVSHLSRPSCPASLVPCIGLSGPSLACLATPAGHISLHLSNSSTQRVPPLRPRVSCFTCLNCPGLHACLSRRAHLSHHAHFSGPTSHFSMAPHVPPSQPRTSPPPGRTRPASPSLHVALTRLRASLLPDPMHPASSGHTLPLPVPVYHPFQSLCITPSSPCASLLPRAVQPASPTPYITLT